MKSELKFYWNFVKIDQVEWYGQLYDVYLTSVTSDKDKKNYKFL